MINTIRRSIQVSVWLFILLVPAVNYYGIMLEQKNRISMDESPLLSLIHRSFKGMDREKVIDLTHRVKGSVWSAEIYGFKISDPLAAFESTVVPVYFYLPLLLSALVPVFFTLVFGRVFCGWICPAGLLMDLNDRLRKLLLKIKYNSRDILFKRKTKYLVLILGILTAFFMGMPLLSLIYPPAIISREIFYKTYYGIWSTSFYFLAFILFFELILSRRWWCRYICPGGAIYIALSKFRRLDIKRDDALCTKCGECDPVCPYDLKPMSVQPGMECDQCSECMRTCKPGALKYIFNLPGIPVARKNKPLDNGEEGKAT